MTTSLASTLAPVRPEDRLLSELRCALHSSGYAALRGVEISIQPDAVVLQGHVPTWHLKQVAQTRVLDVSRLRLVNELRVDND